MTYSILGGIGGGLNSGITLDLLLLRGLRSRSGISGGTPVVGSATLALLSLELGSASLRVRGESRQTV